MDILLAFQKIPLRVISVHVLVIAIVADHEVAGVLYHCGGRGRGEGEGEGGGGGGQEPLPFCERGHTPTFVRAPPFFL